MPWLGQFAGPGTFRIILALLVVVSHASTIKLGRPAVFVFFALSGYWVMKVWAEKYRPSGSLLAFYLSRCLRIWPAFATAFVLAFVARSMVPPGRELSDLTGLLLLGVATTHRDVLGTSWSLDLEIQFYLAVPLILALWRWGDRVTPRKRIGIALVLSTCLTAFAWYLSKVTGVVLFLCYLPCFLVGCAIWSWNLHVSRPVALTSLGLFLASAVVFATLPETRALVIRHDISTWWEDAFGMAWVVVLIPYMVWNVRQPSSWLDGQLGNLSYALYITHFPVIAVTTSWLRPLSMLDRALIGVLVLVVSVVFYVIVDRRWEGARQHFLESWIGTCKRAPSL